MTSSMSRLRKRAASWVSELPPFVPGPKRARYKPNAPVEGIFATCHQQSQSRPKLTDPVAEPKRRTVCVTSAGNSSKRPRSPSSGHRSPPFKRNATGRSTVESVRASKKTTSSAKSKLYKRNTQRTPSTKTSRPASTSKGVKAYRGFWSPLKAALSAKSWLPTETALLASELTSSSGCSRKRAHTSSFCTTRRTLALSRNSLKTSWPSSTSSLVGRTEKEDTSVPLTRSQRTKRAKLYAAAANEDARKALKEKLDAEQKALPARVTRCRLVPLLPTPRQHTYLKRWLSDARTTYNLAVDAVLQHKAHHPSAAAGLAALEGQLQKTLVGAQVLADDPRGRRRILLRTPKVIRQQAVKSVFAHIKAYHTKHKLRQTLRAKYPHALAFRRDVRFQPHYKTRSLCRGAHDSMSVEAKSFKLLKASDADDNASFSLYTTLRPARDLERKLAKSALKPHALKGPRPLRRRGCPLQSSASMSGGRKKDDFLFRNVKVQGQLPHDVFDHDTKIHFKGGRFFLAVPRHVDVGARAAELHSLSDFDEGVAANTAAACRDGREEARPDTREEVLALDPGVRKFLTGYSPQGSIVQVANNANRVLDKCLRRIDRTKLALVQVSTKVYTVQRRRRQALRRARRKYYGAEARAKETVKNLHYNAAHWLLARYKRLLVPTFSSHSCVSRTSRRGKSKKGLPRCVKRRMQMLRFSMFVQRLVQTAAFYPGAEILRGSEAYTSMTCTCCGELNESLGASEVFACDACGLVIDRDVNGARNVYLRFLV